MRKRLTLGILVLLSVTAMMVVTKQVTGSPPPDFAKADIKVEAI